MTKKNLRRPMIGVMGPGKPESPGLTDYAWKLGKGIAQKEWNLVTGGRAAGVMEAAARGAFEAGGTTIGILPGDNPGGVSAYVQIPIVTGMGNARNVINVLTSDVVVICGMGPGTASEAALAVKTGKPIVVTFAGAEDIRFLRRLSGKPVPCFNDVDDVITEIEKLLMLKKTAGT